jgi:hypothetical protein
MLFLLIRRFALGTSVFSSPIFILSILLLILGFQSFLLGLIAELLMRTYHESTQKPTYTVRTVINLPSKQNN